jgi:pimeloyl-ACP methyl ester carboxylesterase
MADRLRHAWAAVQPALSLAEDSERDWSPEYFARWSSREQAGSLGSLPLIVLTRALGGYGDDLDVPASELDAERRVLQRQLAHLSVRGEQRVLASGHDMHLEAPDDVVAAILDVVREVRSMRRRSGG